MLKSKFVLILLTSIIFISCSTYNIQHSFVKPVLKKEVIKKSEKLVSAETNLINRANRFVKKKFKSIVDKKAVPPSGDKRDYYSRAIYYWPDPADVKKKWIYQDGKVNRKSLESTDHFTFFEAMGAVRDLSFAYHLNGDEKYAEKVNKIISQWFIDEETKMNPNFNYAQAIPGKNDGSHWGIISSRAILWVCDGLKLMEDSQSYDNDIYEKFSDWCREYLNWLLTSEFGKKEVETGNNHATHCALQIIEFADFTEQYDLCESQLEKVRKVIIPEQIEPDGSMPEELSRTRPIHYSLFNLSAFFHIAMIGDKYNMNLWEANSDTSGSIIDAFNFILGEVKKFENDKKVEINDSYLFGLLSIANARFDDEFIETKEIIMERKEKIKLIDTYFVF